jgi:polysaccharide deacetylase family protein (PEP-CTERM system associated)
MNILTFDLEEWYVYQLYSKGGKDYYLPILDRYLHKLLDLLDEQNCKATFFCLGEVAREYPDVIRQIAARGHEIGCHSDKHTWITKLTPEEFYLDTKTAIDILQDITGTKVKSYRAPAFSIGDKNKWALEILGKAGIENDCSIFPANRDFGGFPEFKYQVPCRIRYHDVVIKEFPIATTTLFGQEIAYSGGGYFRLIPYSIISKLVKQNEYVMSYFHIRDFDAEQKQIINLRYFKNYYGIKSAYTKLTRFVKEFDFINIECAGTFIDWDNVPIISL